MKELPNKHPSGHCQTTEEKGNQRKEFLRKKREQQDLNTAVDGGGRGQHKTELDKDSWFLAYVPREV